MDGCDARRSPRVSARCDARLFYLDSEGLKKAISASVINMSGSGVLIQTSKSLSIGMSIRIQGNELLVGQACVRRSEGNFWKFRIALEFDRAIPARY